jgi:hypothetical protein
VFTFAISQRIGIWYCSALSDYKREENKHLNGNQLYEFYSALSALNINNLEEPSARNLSVSDETLNIRNAQP